MPLGSSPALKSFLPPDFLLDPHLPVLSCVEVNEWVPRYTPVKVHYHQSTGTARMFASVSQIASNISQAISHSLVNRLGRVDVAPNPLTVIAAIGEVSLPRPAACSRVLNQWAKNIRAEVERVMAKGVLVFTRDDGTKVPFSQIRNIIPGNEMHALSEIHDPSSRLQWEPVSFVHQSPPILQPIMEDWLWELDMLCKDSSVGVTGKLLKTTATSKSEFVLREIKKDRCKEFLTLCCEVYACLRSGAHNFPISAVGKPEDPISWKKALAGRFRSIVVPDFALLMVERKMSAMQSASCPRLTWDDVLSCQRHSIVRTNSWMLGASLQEMYEVLHSRSQREGCLSLDVSGWDRSMSGVVTEALYASFVPIVGTAVGRYLCGRGLYYVGGGLFQLSKQHTLWGSGALLTLAGNSFMHHCHPYHYGKRNERGEAVAVVQGDDANVFGDGLIKADIQREYSRSGLEVRDLEEGCHFCSMDCSSDGRPFAAVDPDKCLARLVPNLAAYRGLAAPLI